MEIIKGLDKAAILRVEITDMAEDGAGIGHTEDGMAVFVNGAVYGDKVNARVTKAKKNYAFAEVVEVLEQSPYRAEFRGSEAESENGANEKSNSGIDQAGGMVCPYIEECGGCAFGRLNYETQLMLKAKHVEDKLKRIAGIENPNIKPIIGMNGTSNLVKELIWPSNLGKEMIWPSNYRNKAVMAVGEDEDGNPIVGFRGGKSHRIVDCETCLIQLPPVMAATTSCS